MSFRSEIVGVASVGGVCDSRIGYGVSMAKYKCFIISKLFSFNIDLVSQTQVTGGMVG